MDFILREIVSLEAARKAVEFLEENMTDGELGDPHLKQTGVSTFPLRKEIFETISGGTSTRKLSFVDGGNQEIIGAPNFSIQLNRVYSSAWSGNKRQFWSVPRVEFFSSTYARFCNGDIRYVTSVIPSAGEDLECLPDSSDLSFESTDRTLMNGNQRADIERVGSVARRFAEWRLGLRAVEELSTGDVLVMDGTLQSNFTNETDYVRELTASATEKGVIVIGISKTSSIFTTAGLSLAGAVDNLAKKESIKGTWYLPVAESTSIDHYVLITIAKLNPFAERVFRVEIQRDQYRELGESGLNEVMSSLSENSSDATFPGYPYGLVDADRFARVSFDEIGYYRALLMSEISKRGGTSKFLSHMHSKDAHNVLNLLVK